MTKSNDPYLLSDKEKQTYHGLLKSAFEAATQFTGSEDTFEQLMSSLISMEAFVRQRNANKMDEELEADFAKQSGFTNAQFNTVSGLLGHASNQVYGMLSRLKDLKEVLNALSIGGAHIDYSEMVYVLTDEGFPVGGERQRDDIHNFLKQPRLAILIKELQTIGIYTDDLVIRVGKVFEDKVRKLPYVIVEIPRLEKQVAVCDQYGETTFVSQKVLPTYIWASYTKKQLKSLEGIQAVPFGEKWPFTVCNLLAYGTSEMTPNWSVALPKIDIEEYERNRKKTRMELNEDIILNHTLVYLKRHKHWPSVTYAKDVEGLPGEKWVSWDNALRNGSRGLSGGSSLWLLIRSFIVNEAKNYRDMRGFLPGQNAGPLINRADISWELVSEGLGKRADLYTLYSSAGLIEKRQSSRAEMQTIGDLTPEIIMDHALSHLKETWRWPDETILTPISGLHREYWLEWDYALGEGLRGLPGGSYLGKTIHDWVVDAARQYLKEHDHLPRAGSGELEGYPGVSWDLIDHGLRRQKYLKMSLVDVLSLHFKNQESALEEKASQVKGQGKIPSLKNE